MENKEIFELIKDLLIAGVGGFMGAIFGLVSQHQMDWSPAWFLIMFYTLSILVIILVLRFFIMRKKGKIKLRRK